MNYDVRNTAQKESREKLESVVKAGEALGLFSLVKASNYEGGDAWRWVTVANPQGHLFSLTGGSWGRDCAITARIDTLREPDGLQVVMRDVMAYKDEAPTASCTHTRTAEAIAKDLSKRVINNPEAMTICAKMVDRMATLKASRASLLGHIETLTALGFVFRDVPPNQTYSAEGYKPSGNPRKVTVTSPGRVSFEADTTVEGLPAVLAALNTQAKTTD